MGSPPLWRAEQQQPQPQQEYHQARVWLRSRRLLAACTLVYRTFREISRPWPQRCAVTQQWIFGWRSLP
jgi:hypothetical protein